MRQLGERRNSIPPEVELTQRQAAGQGRERRDAIDTTKEEKEEIHESSDLVHVDVMSVFTLKRMCVCVNDSISTNLSVSTSMLAIWEKIEIWNRVTRDR